MEGLDLLAAIGGSAAAGLLGALASAVRAHFERRKEAHAVRPHSTPAIEDRADELAEILMRSKTLLDELTAEIAARTATAMDMEAKAKHAANLASLHEEQRQAVEKLLDTRLEARLKESGKKSFLQGMRLNIISGAFFFAAGVVVTILLDIGR
jgi:hypothetical protein